MVHVVAVDIQFWTYKYDHYYISRRTNTPLLKIPILINYIVEGRNTRYLEVETFFVDTLLHQQVK